MLFVFLILACAGIVLAQPSPPAQGIQIGNPAIGLDVRFPLTVIQCEPVFLYYNASIPFSVDIMTPDAEAYLLRLATSVGMGYFEWVCNIPAGYGFWARANFERYYYTVVQPGPLSSCLHNVTTTYQYASYYTTGLATYTSRPPMADTSIPYLYTSATSTAIFPSGSFSTITVNPELIATSSTLVPTTLSTPSAPSRKSKAPAIAGSVIGGIAIAIAFGVVFIRFRKRRSRSLAIPFNVTDQPIATSPPIGWAPAPAFTSHPSSLPTNNSATALNRDSSMQNSDVPPMQTGGPPLAHAGYSLPPASDPQTDTAPYLPQTHELIHPQLAYQRQLSLDSASTSPQAPPAQPASGPGVELTSDIVSTLTTFSRLPPEQMRALFPVLGNIMAVQQPQEPSRGNSAPGAPPL